MIKIANHLRGPPLVPTPYKINKIIFKKCLALDNILCFVTSPILTLEVFFIPQNQNNGTLKITY
jgi:hypothetical protein